MAMTPGNILVELYANDLIPSSGNTSQISNNVVLIDKQFIMLGDSIPETINASQALRDKLSDPTMKGFQKKFFFDSYQVTEDDIDSRFSASGFSGYPAPPYTYTVKAFASYKKTSSQSIEENIFLYVIRPDDNNMYPVLPDSPGFYIPLQTSRNQAVNLKNLIRDNSNRIRFQYLTLDKPLDDSYFQTHDLWHYFRRDDFSYNASYPKQRGWQKLSSPSFVYTGEKHFILAPKNVQEINLDLAYKN